MFVYPERALFNRVVPKSRIYGQASPGRALRQTFVDQVEEIVWRYKLAPETVNLPASTEVKEIQIFSIALRAAGLKEEVLHILDRAIPSLLFFELRFQSRIRFAAAYKRVSEADPSKQVVATYYRTPWRDVSQPREPLPLAIDMGGLYEQMLHRHMLAAGLAPRSGETLAETAERGNLIRAQELVCKKLDAKLRKEDQFNRKVAINAELRRARKMLDELRR